MNIKKLSLAAAVSALTFTTASNAVLGPIPIYLNTEYRTDTPVIGSISSTLTFSEDDIKATGANTFLDFLATVPSIALYNPVGNIPAIFIRGNEAKHTLVLLDGVSVNDISTPDGAVGNGLTSISLNDIEKIDIIKGTKSSLYGSQAIAGVISVTLKKGVDTNDNKVVVTYGTYNSKTYNLTVAHGDEDGFIRASHNQYKSDGFDARVNDITNDLDGQENKTTQVKVGNSNFDISYLKLNNKTEYDRCWTGSTTVDDCNTDKKLNKIAININKEINSNWKTKLIVAQTKTNKIVTKGTVIDHDDKYKSTNITLLNDIKNKDDLIVVGLSRLVDKNLTKSQELSSNELFFDWQKNINDVDVNIGARYIDHNKFGKHNVYSIGAAKYLDDKTKLTAGYGTGFKVPTFYQSNGDTTTNPTITANPDLTPETSKQIELGVEKQYNWGSVEAKIYNNKVNNIVDYVTTACSDGSAISYPPITYAATCNTGTVVNPYYKNLAGLLTKGIEISANTKVDNYNIDFSYNYNNSKKTGEATQNFRRPKNITNISISKQHGSLNSRLQIIAKSSTIESNNTKLDGNILLNAGTDYQIDKQTIASINIKNLTDKKYILATDNINGDFNNSGRTINIGLIYNF